MGHGELWTSDEIELLKKVYSISSVKQLSRLFPNRTMKAIYGQAFELKLKKENTKNRVKWNLELVREYFEKHNCTLNSSNYFNNKLPLDYVCECGEPSTISFMQFLKGERCRKCAVNKAYDYEYVKGYFKQHGCKLMSESYTNNRELLDYICVCGKESRIGFYTFMCGVRCQGCKGQKNAKARKHSYDFVREFFEQQSCKLLSKTYERSSDPLDYVCKCGEPSKIRFNDFRKGVRCIQCRSKIVSEKTRGEKNYRWNPNITDRRRLDKRNLYQFKEWRKHVFERDNYTCGCCGIHGGKLNAHHKDGWNWCVQKRFDLDNGITLCEECHKSFHQEFGKQDNTKEQFELFNVPIAYYHP